MTERKLARAFFAPLVLGLLVVSCGDVLAPELRGASVRIFLGSAKYDEQTIAVGSTLNLSGSVLDAAGKKLDGHTVEWRSDRPDVATVDANGGVIGIAVGTANIIAKHFIGEDTARVNVALPIAGAPSCNAGEELSIAVNETRVVSGAAAASLCLPGNADYSLVVVNTGTTAAATLQTRIRATGVRASIGAPTPLLAPYGGDERLLSSAAFHEHLRVDVSARLEPRMQSIIDIGSLEPGPQANVGEILTLNVESSSSDGCRAENIDNRGVRVRYVSDRAIVVEDTLNPSGGFGPADFQRYGDFFDDEVWPLVTTTFGEPTDIDKNGKVYIIFTKAVNQRRENSDLPAFRGSYVGGFFFNRDLFPTTGKTACEGSNTAEVFYMLVPDPNGVVVGKDALGEYPARRFSLDFVNKSTPNVLVHEFQHLVNDSRRLHVNKSSLWEETWLNEGLSHIAEELMFYDQSGLTPRSNLRGAVFQANANAKAQFATFQLANLDRVAAMLREPDRTSLMGSDILATRGAAWFFLRYAADRRGGDESAFWRTLVRDTKTAGLQNLEDALGEDPRDWIADWATAVYLDDTPVNPPAKYQILSWDFRNLYPAASNLWPGNFYSQYPLAVLPIAVEPAVRNISLQGGAAAYLRTGVASGLRGAIRVTVGDLPAPSRLRVVVTRLR